VVGRGSEGDPVAGGATSEPLVGVAPGSGPALGASDAVGDDAAGGAGCAVGGLPPVSSTITITPAATSAMTAATAILIAGVHVPLFTAPIMGTASPRVEHSPDNPFASPLAFAHRLTEKDPRPRVHRG
jgi:hypothetical protein